MNCAKVTFLKYLKCINQELLKMMHLLWSWVLYLNLRVQFKCIVQVHTVIKCAVRVTDGFK